MLSRDLAPMLTEGRDRIVVTRLVLHSVPHSTPNKVRQTGHGVVPTIFHECKPSYDCELPDTAKIMTKSVDLRRRAVRVSNTDDPILP